VDELIRKSPAAKTNALVTCISQVKSFLATYFGPLNPGKVISLYSIQFNNV